VGNFWFVFKTVFSAGSLLVNFLLWSTSLLSLQDCELVLGEQCFWSTWITAAHHIRFTIWRSVTSLISVAWM